MRTATVVAISIVAYALVSIIHEAGGHWLVAASLGLRVTSISSVNMLFDESVVSSSTRAASAAGALANVLTALLALVVLRRRALSANIRYFLWLFLSVSLLLATGYPGFSAVVGSGDWVNVIRGLPHQLAWRLVLFAVSVALYGGALRLSVRELACLIGSRNASAAKRLVIPAYLAGGLLFCAAAAFNPVGPRMVIWAGAASFGAMLGIVFALLVFSSDEEVAVPIEPSVAWVLSAMLVGSFFVAVLGSGLRL